MGTHLEEDIDQPQFGDALPVDDWGVNAERGQKWFLGSLMRDSSPHNDFVRLSSLHNRITRDVTRFDERFQRNLRISTQLSEFFPSKWLLEILGSLRSINPNHLGIRKHLDRVCSFLGYIELYLSFRGLTLLDSTIVVINTSLGVNITKNDVRAWKLKLIRIIPELRNQWIKIRAQTHESALFSTVVQVMNREMVLEDSSKKEIFMVKQACLRIAKVFISTSKARHVKKPEVWARAICVKALRETLPNFPFPFPEMPAKTRKVVENKCWQLDKIKVLTH